MVGLLLLQFCINLLHQRVQFHVVLVGFLLIFPLSATLQLTSMFMSLLNGKRDGLVILLCLNCMVSVSHSDQVF